MDQVLPSFESCYLGILHVLWTLYLSFFEFLYSSFLKIVTFGLRLIYSHTSFLVDVPTQVV